MANTEALLLDTHAFLWAIFEPERLPKAVRRWLATPDLPLHLSVASVWEIALKHGKGKLQAEAGIIDANIRSLGIYPLAITLPHIRALDMLPVAVHKDPFDRLIAAQAIAEKLPLVTADRAFAQYPGVAIRW